jgi:hypothetical protein
MLARGWSGSFGGGAAFHMTTQCQAGNLTQGHQNTHKAKQNNIWTAKSGNNNGSNKSLTAMEKWTIATWHVGGIAPKMEELLIEIERMKIHITVVTETKRKGKNRWKLEKTFYIQK